MSSECVLEAFSTPAEWEWVGRAGARLAAELAGPPPPPPQRGDPWRPPMSPLNAFSALYGVRLDPWMVHRIRSVTQRVAYRPWAGEPRRIPRGGRTLDVAAGGSVYAFRDPLDPPSLVKVGSTYVGFRVRLGQWEAELGRPPPPEAPPLTGLWSVGCLAPRFAEDILHTLLKAWKADGRINRATGRILTEYYWVADPETLRVLATAVARYTDYAVSVYRLHAPRPRVRPPRGGSPRSASP